MSSDLAINDGSPWRAVVDTSNGRDEGIVVYRSMVYARCPDILYAQNIVRVLEAEHASRLIDAGNAHG